MNRRSAAVTTLVLAAALAGGCSSTQPQKKAQVSGDPCLIAGDSIGRSVFSNDRRITWASTRPADAFANVPGTFHLSPE
jgi:hypothetical protein